MQCNYLPAVENHLEHMVGQNRKWRYRPGHGRRRWNLRARRLRFPWTVEHEAQEMSKPSVIAPCLSQPQAVCGRRAPKTKSQGLFGCTKNPPT